MTQPNIELTPDETMMLAQWLWTNAFAGLARLEVEDENNVYLSFYNYNKYTEEVH